MDAKHRKIYPTGCTLQPTNFVPSTYRETYLWKYCPNSVLKGRSVLCFHFLTTLHASTPASPMSHPEAATQQQQQQQQPATPLSILIRNKRIEGNMRDRKGRKKGRKWEKRGKGNMGNWRRRQTGEKIKGVCKRTKKKKPTSPSRCTLHSFFSSIFGGAAPGSTVKSIFSLFILLPMKESAGLTNDIFSHGFHCSLFLLLLRTMTEIMVNLPYRHFRESGETLTP